MNTTNAILGGIDIWLRERGHKSVLNITARRSFPCLAGVPNITLPIHQMAILVQDDHLRVGMLSPYDEGKSILLELADPGMWEQLEALMAEQMAMINAQNTT